MPNYDPGHQDPITGNIGQAIGGDVGDQINKWNYDPGKQFGTPGENKWKGTEFQNSPTSGYDPGAFQGGWNDANSPYSPANMYANAQAAQGQQAPGLANQFGVGGFNSAQQGQSALAGLLMGQANGTAPSLAGAQLRAGQQTNAANAMAMQAQARGVNPSMSAYNAGQINAAGNQQVNQDSAMAGIMERNTAAGQLGSVLNSQGQMGLSAASTGAGLTMQQQAQNNQLTQYYLSQGMSAQQAQLQANIAMQSILAGSYNATQGLNQNTAAGNAQNNANLTGGLIAGGASVGGGVLGAMMAQGGVVPGYAGGGKVAGPPPLQSQPKPIDDGLGLYRMFGSESPAGDSLRPLGQDIGTVLRADGGSVPGPMDTGRDQVQVGLRPGEVVVPQENPIYPQAKAAVQQQRPSRMHAIASEVVNLLMKADFNPDFPGTGLVNRGGPPAASSWRGSPNLSEDTAAEMKRTGSRSAGTGMPASTTSSGG